MKQSILKDKSKGFALRVIRLYKYLCEEKKEYVLSKQLLRSGTSIGANIAEAFYGQSEADFVSKLSIAQKEAGETIYWLELLHESEYLKQNEYDSIHGDAEELIKLLTSSIKTVKEKSRQPNLITNH
ncbi:MAG: four helix bundle protein [Prevotella sp.]